MDLNEKIRSYEVSIWTLQDDFITVLKHSNLESKGQIQEGIVELNIDGTQNISFKIPMYLEQGVENPLWYTVDQGLLITNMRKLKVIFNKKLPEEQVLEFLIVNVEETHENDELYCTVQGESLAFHELGKRGYKIAYSSEDYWNDPDVIAWYDGSATYQRSNPEPIANIQWWLNKFMMPLPTKKKDIQPQTWYYELQMDWSSFPNADQLSSKKIYDEEYVTNWIIDANTDELIPGNIQPPREKSRMLDFSESNIYNITQQLAETFGVFCRYEYSYDSNYHIIGRKAVFYNNFYSEKLGFLDFTYPYSTEQVRRITESQDLITKLYVKSVEDTYSASGQVSILGSEANLSKEDYILNFDYLYDVGTLSTTQKKVVKRFETNVRNINMKIEPRQLKLVALQNKLPELKAELTVAQNSAQQARARMNDIDNLYIKLTEGDGYIEVTAEHPASAVLLQDSSVNSDDKNQYYYIKISEKGVVTNSVRIYRNINTTTHTLSGRIKNGAPQYDEYGNLIRINNLTKLSDDSRSTVYLTYRYKPQLYYDNIKKVWEKRLAQDEADITKLNNEITTLESSISTLEKSIQTQLDNKKKLITEFEEEMGIAIREGYWQPENYNDYGNRMVDSALMDLGSEADVPIECNTSYAELIWSTESLVGEYQTNYKIGVDENSQYYFCIRLFDSDLKNIKDHLDELNFCFFDYDYTTSLAAQSPANYKCLPLGSQCELVFIYDKSSSNTFPALLLTGEKLLANGTTQEALLERMKKSGFIGKLTSKWNAETEEILTTQEVYISRARLNSESDIHWINLSEELNNELRYVAIYPRIKIKSLNLKRDEKDLGFTYYNEKLSEFKDYSILSYAGETDAAESGYYITIKPEVFVRHGIINKRIKFYYTLSTAATAIYLDALQVSRENAYPKVSYEIDPNIYGTDFMHTAYNALGIIAHINDTKLKLSNVMGYISKVELNLDMPWEDKIEIQNYKNKFEDLFSTIVAQTEAIKAAEPVITSAANILTLDGTIKPNAVKEVIRHADLDYAFNNGSLTIDNENGIWGTSDSGVVAFRGGGIFTATEKNEDDNWKWNTGITPEGINADLITTGQLDTNLINIYAGDEIKFQMNGKGIFAYHSYFDDLDKITDISLRESLNSYIADNQENDIPDDLDYKQYVKYDSNGLFLIAEQGAAVLNKERTAFIDNGSLNRTVKRVEISWDGLILRNWENNRVFYADPDTGDLTITGHFMAKSLTIGNNDFTEDILRIQEIGSSVDDALLIAQGKPNTFIQNTAPQNYKEGDIWFNSYTGLEYVAQVKEGQLQWVFVATNKIVGTKMTVDAEGGVIELKAPNAINIASGQDLTIHGGTVKIAGDSSLVLESGGTIKIGNVDYTSDIQSIAGIGMTAQEATDLAVQAMQINQQIQNGLITVYYATLANKPKNYKKGDIWYVSDTTGTKTGWAYVAEADYEINVDHWKPINTSKLIGTGITVDANTGVINITAENILNIASGKKLSITGGEGVYIGSGGKLTIESAGDFSLTSTNFQVTTDGTISAKAGTVGGWTLSNNMLISGSSTNRVGMSANMDTTGNNSYSTTIPAGDGTDSTRAGYYAFWAGATNPANAPFRVTRDGVVFVSKLISKEPVEGSQTVIYNTYNLYDTTNSSGGGGGGGSGGGLYMNPTLEGYWNSSGVYTATMSGSGKQKQISGTIGSISDITLPNTHTETEEVNATISVSGGGQSSIIKKVSINASAVYNAGWSSGVATCRGNATNSAPDSGAGLNPTEVTLGYGETKYYSAQYKETSSSERYFTVACYKVTAPNPSGTFPINYNDIFDVTGWKYVNVNVPTPSTSFSISKVSSRSANAVGATVYVHYTLNGVDRSPSYVVKEYSG